MFDYAAVADVKPGHYLFPEKDFHTLTGTLVRYQNKSQRVCLDVTSGSLYLEYTYADVKGKLYLEEYVRVIGGVKRYQGFYESENPFEL